MNTGIVVDVTGLHRGRLPNRDFLFLLLEYRLQVTRATGRRSRPSLHQVYQQGAWMFALPLCHYHYHWRLSR